MKRVVVVGGGLAGMISAREIKKRGHEVVLLESSNRLGGKAGADIKDGRVVEHGYHVFPAWYPNVRRLVAEIGVKLIDFDRYHYLSREKFPKVVTVRAPTGVGAVMHDMFDGLLPWYEEFLFAYFTLDMLGRSLSEKRLLDRISTVGLMRQAWYMTERVAELNQENMLKASAIPAYDMSAMTAKKVGTYWLRQASPFLSVLPGDLQTTFIDPIAKTVRDAGVDIRLEHTVASFETKDGRLAKAILTDGRAFEADAFVLATPLEVARQFVTGPVYELDPALGNIHDLEARPMAAMQVRLKRTLPGIPREHVFLHGGTYGLSFIDVAQIWPDQPTTNLFFIMSNYIPLMAVDEATAIRMLMAEVRAYLPITEADIDTIDLNPNVTSQLFINTIGAWPNRPEAKSKIPNLFVAGDYAKNAIDLACMEGAVSSAILAARAAVETLGGHPVPEPDVPPEFPRALVWVSKILFAPPVAVAAVVARIRQVFSGAD